jgi:hypothetical protein
VTEAAEKNSLFICQARAYPQSHELEKEMQKERKSRATKIAKILKELVDENTFSLLEMFDR